MNAKMDLSSLHLQRDCAIGVTRWDNGMRFNGFCSCDLDLDLDQVTLLGLLYELDLEILKIYLHTESSSIWALQLYMSM